MKYISVCSGIEAATVAWHPLGWQPVAFSEIEPFPAAVLAHHYPNVPNLGDMTAINGDEWRDKVDVIVGGTPCQAFSVAGKRGGLADKRGQLTLKFTELADAINPAFTLWENVPGVLSDKTNGFGNLLAALCGADEALETESGKWPRAGLVCGKRRRVAWCVLDAQYFGVAQRRRRVFALAVDNNVITDIGESACPAQILSIGKSLRGDTPTRREEGQEIAGTISRCSFTGGASGRPEGAAGNHFVVAAPLTTNPYADNASREDCLVFDRQSRREWGTENVAGSVCARDYKAPADLIAFHPTQDPIHSADGSCHALGCGSGGRCATHAVAVGGDIAHCLRGGKTGYAGSEDGTGRGIPIIAFDTTQITSPANGCNPKHGDPCHPLAAGAHPPAIAKPTQVRRLTPVECERLQGFPDGYTLIPVNTRKKIEDDYREYLKQHYPDMSNDELERLAKDGPRYKALGNSMAVPVMRWIGERIQLACNVKE